MTSKAADIVDEITPISDTLREYTGELHRATEALPALSILLTGDLDIEAYRRTQARFYGVFRPLETSIEDSILWSTLGIKPPASTQRLAQDLRALGEDEEMLPMQVVDLPVDLFAALGRAYVLEGSALGARFIDKQLARHAWYAHRRHGNYFAGTAVVTRWQQFRNAINLMTLETQERNTILTSAHNTFELIHDWMKG